jgi:hypothetical protein
MEQYSETTDYVTPNRSASSIYGENYDTTSQKGKV